MWCSLPVNTQHRRLGGLVVEGIVQLAHLDLVLKVLGRVLQVLLEPRVATPEVDAEPMTTETTARKVRLSSVNLLAFAGTGQTGERTQQRRPGLVVFNDIVQLAQLFFMFDSRDLFFHVRLEPREVPSEVVRGAQDDKNHRQEGAVIGGGRISRKRISADGTLGHAAPRTPDGGAPHATGTREHPAQLSGARR